MHCLQREFLQVSKLVYEKLQEYPEWLIFCLDTVHNCLRTSPRELAVLLHGVSLLMPSTVDK